MTDRRRAWFVMVVAVAMAGSSLAGCGKDAAVEAVPSGEQLAATLLAGDDLASLGTWTVSTGPEGDTAVSPAGVVSEAGSALLPGLELCDAAGADARAEADALRWKAFRQLDQDEADPIAPPSDRRGRMVFVQEYLTSAEPAAIETTFNLLRDGLAACLGPIPAGEEGPGRMEAITLPAVGADRYAVLTTLEEAGGGAEWHLAQALVRRGAVLLSITFVEITAGEGIEPLYDEAAFGDVVTAAVDKR